MMTVGVTGGIGSGKSTVAGLLVADSQAELIDADKIARDATASGGSAIADIRQHFGPSAIASDGSLDRNAMRKRVFDNPIARRELESIVHPIIRRDMDIAMETARVRRTRCVIVDIPLLVESEAWSGLLDKIVVVDCSEESQLQRVRRRNALGDAAIKKIIDVQASRGKRRAAADAILFNDGDNLDVLRREVVQLAKYLQL